jgi:hypothetical protein
MKQKILTLVIALSCQLTLFCQKYDITGVKRVSSSAVRAIIENNEVKGYYAFVITDKASKKENVYNLAILDNNLKQLYSVDLTEPSGLRLLESSYNGDGFCFTFLNRSEKKISIIFLDKTGKTVAQKSMEISNGEANLYASQLQTDDDAYNGSLMAVKGKGFVRFGYEKEAGSRITIEMYDNTGTKKWDGNSGVDSKKSYESVTPYYGDDKVVVALLNTREKLLTTKGMKFSLVFYNTETGKEYFRRDVKAAKFQQFPMGVSPGLNGTYFVYGQYYNLEDDTKDDPKGLYIEEVDLTGKTVSESYTPWQGEINAAIVKKSKGLEKNTKTFIHKVIKTADGKILAIGEQYRKAVSGLGVASTVLGVGNASVMKIEILNMMAFEFDSNLKFKDVQVFEKDKTNVQLPQGWGVIDANLLGFMMQQYGYFDYSYTAISADRKLFNSAYVNYDKDKEAGSNYTVGNISYTKDQKLVIDKVKLTTKPTSFWVVEARPGYVAIFEYFKKEKRAGIRLEKLNL